MMKYKHFMISTLMIAGVSLVSCLNTNQAKVKSLIQKDSISDVLLLTVDDSATLSSMSQSYYYHDSLLRGEPLLINKLQNKVFIQSPTFLISADNHQYLYFVLPGESLGVKSNPMGGVVFYKKGDEFRSRELSYFKKLADSTGELYYNGFSSSSAIRTVKDVAAMQQNLKEIGQTYAKRMAVLKADQLQQPFRPAFEKLACDVIRFAALNDSLSFMHKNFAFLENKGKLNDLIASIKTSIDREPYAPYIFYLWVADRYVRINMRKEKKNLESLAAELEMTDHLLLNRAHDVLLTNLLLRWVSKGGDAKLLDHYLTKVGDEQLRSIVQQERTELTQAVRVGSDGIETADRKNVDLSQVLEESRGNVVLIDFWASWCVPCRQQIPATRSLLKKLEGEKFIFMSLSIDKKYDDWKKALQEESDDFSHSYRFLNAQSADIVKRFKISAIPRYILLGADGKVITENAPRPDDDELLSLIEQNLSKK